LSRGALGTAKVLVWPIEADGGIVEHDHAGTQAAQQLLVVGNDHRCPIGAVGEGSPVQFEDQFVNVPAHHRVQTRGRLVIEDDCGVHGNGPGDGDPFGHSAGEIFAILVDDNRLSEQRSDQQGEDENEESEPDTGDIIPPPDEPALDLATRQHIEQLFDQARKDPTKAVTLKQELDRRGVFKLYENRFLDLFRRGE
jgi:hypothetical protein